MFVRRLITRKMYMFFRLIHTEFIYTYIILSEYELNCDVQWVCVVEKLRHQKMETESPLESRMTGYNGAGFFCRPYSQQDCNVSFIRWTIWSCPTLLIGSTSVVIVQWTVILSCYNEGVSVCLSFVQMNWPCAVLPIDLTLDRCTAEVPSNCNQPVPTRCERRLH